MDKDTPDVLQIRKQHNLRQVDLAQLLEVNQSAVSHWERGRKRMSPEHKERMRQLGLWQDASAPESRILTGKEEETPSLADSLSPEV